MKILLDTNILTRTADPRHAFHQLAIAAPRQLRSDGHELLIVPQVLYEYWTVVTRPLEQNGLGLSAPEASQDLEQITKLYQLLRDERRIL